MEALDWFRIREQRSLRAFGDRLRSFGFQNYAEYLASDLWQRKRSAFLAGRRQRRCKFCKTGFGQLDVHHRTYERVCDERMSDLMLVCHDCHQKVHQMAKDRLWTVEKATDRFRVPVRTRQRVKRQSRRQKKAAKWRREHMSKNRKNWKWPPKPVVIESRIREGNFLRMGGRLIYNPL